MEPKMTDHKKMTSFPNVDSTFKRWVIAAFKWPWRQRTRSVTSINKMTLYFTYESHDTLKSLMFLHCENHNEPVSGTQQ